MIKRISSIRLHDKIAFVMLPKGRRAMIDVLDVPLAEGHYWSAVTNSNGKIKVCTKVDGRVVYLHRLVCERRDGIDASRNVYHQNGNGLDNRRCNLVVPVLLDSARNSGKQSNHWGRL